MKSLNRLVAVAALVSAALAGLFVQRTLASFTPGNLVVVRLGDGVTALTSAAAAVFLDEFTTTGAVGGPTVALPTVVGIPGAGNCALTNSGSASSEGALARSADGRYLTLAGYNAAPATASVVGGSAARVVARVDASAAIDSTTCFTTGYSGNNIRGAVTDDGTRFWTSGPSTGGTRFLTLGAGINLQPSSGVTNTRVVNNLRRPALPDVGLRRVPGYQPGRHRPADVDRPDDHAPAGFPDGEWPQPLWLRPARSQRRRGRC